MTQMRIVCVNKVTNPNWHTHISDVGTGLSASRWSVKWTVPEVLASMDLGNTFYTIGSHSGKQIDVEAYRCSCGIRRIKTLPDDVLDNNLDNMDTCGI